VTIAGAAAGGASVSYATPAEAQSIGAALGHSCDHRQGHGDRLGLAIVVGASFGSRLAKPAAKSPPIGHRPALAISRTHG
jgi:hypothetical protein